MLQSALDPRNLLIMGLALLGGCKSTTPTEDQGVDAEPIADGTPVSPDRGRPSPDGPLALQVGSFLDFAADGSGKIVGSTPVTGVEKFLLLLVSQDEAALASHAYSAQDLGAQPMQGPPGGREGGEGRAAPRRCRFSEELAAIRASHPAALRAPKTWSQAGTPPKLGEQRSFTISAGLTTVTINAEVILVDGVAAYWIDKTTTPLISIDPGFLSQVAAGFSKTVLPRERIYFGKESDIDGDGTVSVLFSSLVAEEAIAYVSPCDLVDPALVPTCKGSNQMELLYLSPPSSLKPPMNTPAALLEVAAHEFQHAIYFYRKFLVRNTIDNENPYVTEGLSSLAEDLSGYGSGNFFLTQAALQNFDATSVPNITVSDIKSYLAGSADGYHRSLAYLLMRHLFDRAGGDKLDAAGTPQDVGGIAFLKAYVDSKPTGLAGLATASALSSADLVMSLWTTLAVSNRGPGGTSITGDPKLNFQAVTTDPVTGKPRGCNLFGSYHGITLSGPKTQVLGSADGKLLAGGAELLLLEAKAGQPVLGFRLETPPAARARARLVRIQ